MSIFYKIALLIYLLQLQFASGYITNPEHVEWLCQLWDYTSGASWTYQPASYGIEWTCAAGVTTSTNPCAQGWVRLLCSLINVLHN